MKAGVSEHFPVTISDNFYDDPIAHEKGPRWPFYRQSKITVLFYSP
jgi:hypothetical protein